MLFRRRRVELLHQRRKLLTPSRDNGPAKLLHVLIVTHYYVVAAKPGLVAPAATSDKTSGAPRCGVTREVVARQMTAT
jgi:hypothetical protein